MFNKLTGPGLLRLILAEVVFVHHLSRFAVGESAVYIFFFLSGFWIYQMYTGRYSRTKSPYFTYLVSRLWRLLPTFWLISVLMFVFLSLNGNLGSFIQKDGLVRLGLSSLFIFGYNLLPAVPLVPAWSLDIEMQFYLVAPLFAIALHRWPGKKAIPLLTCIALGSIIFFFSGNRLFAVSYLPFFLVGMVVSAVQWKPSFRLSLAFLGAMVLALVVCLCSPWRGILLLGSHPGPLAHFNLVANVILAVCVFPYAAYTTRQKGFSQDRMFGDLSYVIYLLHWVGVVWCSRYATDGALRRVLYAGFVWIAVTLVSWAIWKFYDHPINRMRANWVTARLKPVEKTATEAAQVAG